jgi:DNA-binding transcriptional regulator LsrR (DeoR family)
MIGRPIPSLARQAAAIDPHSSAEKPDKTDAILGALRGGFITALITDEPTARNVLGRL